MIATRINESVGFVGSHRYDCLKSAWDALPLASLLIDENGDVEWANTEACEALRLGLRQVQGRSIKGMFVMQDAIGSEDADLPWGRLLQLGKRFQSPEYVYLRPVGTDAKAWSLSVEPVTVDESGRKAMLVSLRPACQVKGGLTPKLREKAGQKAMGIDLQQKSVFVRSSGKYVRVLLDDLLWVEAMENYVQLHTTKERFTVHATLKSMEDALAGKGFMRIHRSFIAKMDEIQSIEENHVQIHGTALPIGKSYRTELLDSLIVI